MDHDTSMDEEPRRRKKNFLSGLFRRRSDAPKGERNGKLQKEYPIRPGRRDGPRFSPDGVQVRGGPRRRPLPEPPRRYKGKEREEANGGGRGGHGFSEHAPLTRWPPPGRSSSDQLTSDHAVELISRGVPHFKGHKRRIPHASDQYYGLYATVNVDHDEEQNDDAVDPHNAMIQLMSLRMHGSGFPVLPWETLEQPSMACGFGYRPGTITLNRWVAYSSVMPVLTLRDAGAGARREVGLAQIFERLRELEAGYPDPTDEVQMYNRLYRRFLRDPDRLQSPHRPLAKQIEDLIQALSGADLVDLTNPRNQVVTKFIYDAATASESPEARAQYTAFFYQLLLALELDLRINNPPLEDEAGGGGHDEASRATREKLIAMIPPRIQWNLALARRWRHHIRVEDWGDDPDQVRLKFRLRKRQTKVLKRFAKLMKWPNLNATTDAISRRDAEGSSVSVSSHAMAFFSGLVLPGPTYPFLLMNSLIDIDPDRATDDLALLTHLHPSCGFQYRNSYTYWASSCIVGKVLAPTCRELAGWIGPAMPTLDLGRSQIARIRARKPPPSPASRQSQHQPQHQHQQKHLTLDDVVNMAESSDPLGPPDSAYPVADYILLTPDPDDLVDTVRIQQVSLTDIATAAGGNGGPDPAAVVGAAKGPRVFDAAVQFAIDGASWPLNLSYDVSFISAWPCAGAGPHPLFFDYGYDSVRADELVEIRNWGRPPPPPPTGNAEKSKQKEKAVGFDLDGGAEGSARNNNNNRAENDMDDDGGSGSGSRSGSEDSDRDRDHDRDPDRVLVVEAFGVSDNEVLARAWCAQWGLSAVVADVRKTCAACAIREAYAATLTVVILVEEQPGGD